MSYSQSSEEAEILKYFNGKIGKFLDCGSFDGKTFSNTYQLALNGWTGVAIEASPINFVPLQRDYKDLPVKLVCGALHTDESGIVKFYDSNGDAVGTTEEANRATWSTVLKFQEIYIVQFSIKNFIKNFGADFDFISIDTEGTSSQLFGRMIEMFDPQLWCVEHDGNIDYCIERATMYGYKELYRSGENILLGK